MLLYRIDSLLFHFYFNTGELGAAREVLRKLRGYVGGEDADVEIEIELEAILDSCIATRRQGKEKDKVFLMIRNLRSSSVIRDVGL